LEASDGRLSSYGEGQRLFGRASISRNKIAKFMLLDIGGKLYIPLFNSNAAARPELFMKVKEEMERKEKRLCYT
jgi:hypothetical protein